MIQSHWQLQTRSNYTKLLVLFVKCYLYLYLCKCIKLLISLGPEQQKETDTNSNKAGDNVAEVNKDGNGGEY